MPDGMLLMLMVSSLVFASVAIVVISLPEISISCTWPTPLLASFILTVSSFFTGLGKVTTLTPLVVVPLIPEVEVAVVVNVMVTQAERSVVQLSRTEA